MQCLKLEWYFHPRGWLAHLIFNWPWCVAITSWSFGPLLKNTSPIFFFVLKRTWTIYSKYKYLKDRSKKGHVEYTCRAFQKIQMHGYLFLLFSTILIKLHDGFFCQRNICLVSSGSALKFQRGLMSDRKTFQEMLI